MNNENKYSLEPTLCNEVIFEDSEIKITKIWTWNVRSIYKDENENLYKVLLCGEYFNGGGKSTLVFPNGKRPFELEFDYLSDFEDGMNLVVINGQGCGFIDTNCEIAIPLKYVKAKDFNNGYARVYNGEEWLFLDKVGKELFLGNKYQQIENFSDELARVSTQTIGLFNLAYHSDYDEFAGTWGYVDKHGKEVIPPQYIYAFDFLNNRAIVAKGKWTKDSKWDNNCIKGGYWTEDELWGVIDKQGNEIIPCQYDEIKQFMNDDYSICEDYFIVHVGGWKNGKWAIADRNGKFITAPIFEDIGYDYRNGLFTYYDQSSWDDEPKGIYDLNENKILFSPRFDDVYFIDDGNILVEVFDKTLGYKIEKIINKQGEDVFKSNYTRIRAWKYPYETRIYLSDKKIFGLIDKDGKILASCEANDINTDHTLEKVDFKNKRYCYINNGKIGIKDLSGNIIISAQYDKLYTNNVHIYEFGINKNDKTFYGLCKHNGVRILPAEYKNIQILKDNKIICNGKHNVEVYEYLTK